MRNFVQSNLHYPASPGRSLKVRRLDSGGNWTGPKSRVLAIDSYPIQDYSLAERVRAFRGGIFILGLFSVHDWIQVTGSSPEPRPENNMAI